jgi:hypothetical protein
MEIFKAGRASAAKPNAVPEAGPVIRLGTADHSDALFMDNDT